MNIDDFVILVGPVKEPEFSGDTKRKFDVWVGSVRLDDANSGRTTDHTVLGWDKAFEAWLETSMGKAS